MIKNVIYISISLFIVFIAAIMNEQNSRIQESITYFPIDPKISFIQAYTSLQLMDKASDHKYSVKWEIASILDRKAYLRQDIGLLFSNGRLVSTLWGWKPNSERINQAKQVIGENSTFNQAITFHHAEVHEEKNQIFSSQKMTFDHLYIINSQKRKKHSFRTVHTEEEKIWKNSLDQKTNRLLQNSWEKGINGFSIDPNQYYSFPLTKLPFEANAGFPGFSEKETKKIVGNLWEGLYKNYFLGIKKADGTSEKPIGSTIPLILLSKDKTHLLVITETAKNETILLRQMIEYGH